MGKITPVKRKRNKSTEVLPSRRFSLPIFFLHLNEINIGDDFLHFFFNTVESSHCKLGLLEIAV